MLNSTQDKVGVENNSLSDIIENKASGVAQEEKYQKAQDALTKATEEFKAKNCAGLSGSACSAKMDAHRDELLAGFAEAGSDFLPVYGDYKSFKEADSALGYLAAVVGILPGLGDVAGKTIKLAEKALAKGDLAEASKLINKANLAGVTAAATTGKGIGVSAGINMGGAALGSAIKGEDPTNSVISTGFGSVAGSLGGKVVDSLSPVTDQVTKDVIGAVTGSTASELTGKTVKDELDKRERK